eukprot:TRINITY_DN9370_c0_g1_i1.p2 TRINITY_DN9370_c0_g1~~TRINITY_DN9370_c0_g1_i1.p2  ORF type:complete len:244 (+),score=26.24 TRINITY_DN9370_c0_g1_i1:209-940(+)
MPPKKKDKGKKSTVPVETGPPQLYIFGKPDETIATNGSCIAGQFKVSAGEVVQLGPPTVTGHRFHGTCDENGLKQGNGREIFPNGAVFDGNYVDGQRQGQGVLIYNPNTHFKGHFQAGLFHGEGTLTSAQAVYSGNWEAGKLTGQCKIQYADGSVYQGDAKDTKRHGFGNLTDADGNIYSGEWINDKRHGHGCQTWTWGLSYQGEWALGKLHGIGKRTFPSGKIENGRFDQGKYLGLDAADES